MVVKEEQLITHSNSLLKFVQLISQESLGRFVVVGAVVVVEVVVVVVIVSNFQTSPVFSSFTQLPSRLMERVQIDSEYVNLQMEFGSPVEKVLKKVITSLQVSRAIPS